MAGPGRPRTGLFGHRRGATALAKWVPVTDGKEVASVSYADDLGPAAEEWAAFFAHAQGDLDSGALLHLNVHVGKNLDMVSGPQAAHPERPSHLDVFLHLSDGGC